MKRRHRKQVLDINGESDSPRRRWPTERQSQNGSPSNPLSNLVSQYNSDSDDETKPRAHKLNDQFNDFLKEIQSIAPENSDQSNQDSTMAHPGSFWQECYDEQTGYPYYWHTQTNQVTWEIPSELKLFKEKSASVPHASHIPQWSNMPPNKYSSSNIPDGMIPKEVVQRNRNRQAGISTAPAKPASKPNSNKYPGFKNHHDDEGKIEMITSFGNDESESEESDKEELPPPVKLPPAPKKSAMKAPKPAEAPSKPSESNVIVGPALPPVHYGPQNRESLSEKLSLSVCKEKRKSPVMSSHEEDILTRLKNQAKILQRNNPRLENESNKSNDKDGPQKDLKLSLVPGYDDDSEGEEETRKSSAVKPLFPITETSSTDSNSGKIARSIETTAGKIRIYEYKNTDSNDAEEMKEEETKSKEVIEEKPEEEKTDLESKANKFLESIDPPSKAFQRKKRIAFDVAPTKSKPPEPIASKEDSSSPVHTTDGVERRGFGFSKEKSPEEEANKTESEVPTKKTMTFVKSSSPAEDNNSNSSSSAPKTKEITEADKTAMKELTEPIMEKLRFLSEGNPATSAVQVMAIQIQTLLTAWESGSLTETYLRNWLTGTGCELTRLEQTAAPPGWECQWDRSHKRYYYRNTTTAEAQWTYPETGIAGGAEEMELCTTPPPPEHEEPPIIEMSAQAASMSNPESNVEQKPKDQVPTEPPPPPTISGPPSPPPPPHINADDLKRGSKRKASPDESDSNSRDGTPQSSKPNEPLPPGVDPPEIAYTLPGSALDASVLYGAQQTNPIYAATLGAAGIPLLSHPHTALMQGQLMHYNPAYHQHFHNQAMVAARLSGQEAVAQFMVAEYARVYDQNNQVIAKPPVKVQHDAALGSALNSFYSDIASMEKSTAVAEAEKERIQAEQLRLAAEATHQSMMIQAAAVETEVPETKEKKKKKLKTGIGKKQKEMSSMVAKWQRAQMNYKEGH